MKALFSQPPVAMRWEFDKLTIKESQRMIPLEGHFFGLTGGHAFSGTSIFSGEMLLFQCIFVAKPLD